MSKNQRNKIRMSNILTYSNLEIRDKISKKMKGRILTVDHKKKLSDAHKGYVMPQIQRDKISAGIKKTCSERYRGKLVGIICQRCGLKQTVGYGHRNQMYCSNHCKIIALNAQRRKRSSVRYNKNLVRCMSCFKTLPFEKRDQRFCDSRCYHIFYSGNMNVSSRKEVKEKISQSNAQSIQDGKHNPIRGNSGYFFSIKNNKNMYYRSSWELIAFKERESNSEVIGYESESLKIRYVNFEGNVHYSVPDLLTFYKDGTIELAEVKPSWKIDTNFGNTNEKIDAYKEYAKNKGWRFSVLTEKELNI